MLEMSSFEIFLFTLALIFLISGIDDLIIDLAHMIFFKARPKTLSKQEWVEADQREEKRIAIMVPAWNEHEVLAAMIRTNIQRIRYLNYQFFIGVYPNDLRTIEVAKVLQTEFPDMVNVIITDRPGPTTKAHCLNNIFESIKMCGYNPHYIAMHDAEDVIHPDSLTLINAQSNDLDFIQIPVFSLPVPLRSLVDGTYMDEFAENHLKELMVRQALKMPIPSAGVGTFFSMSILLKTQDQWGYAFHESNLTEDYELSMRIARAGAKQLFLVARDRDGKGFVATRGYFPEKFRTSIRQKTRWITGIMLQNLHLNDPKGIAAKYGISRDRKGLITNPISLIGWISSLVYIGILLFNRNLMQNFVFADALSVLTYTNFGIFAVRLIQRLRFTTQVYGFGHGILSIPRVLLLNFINAAATIRAIFHYIRAKPTAGVKQIKWDKTDHRFPTPEVLVKSS